VTIPSALLFAAALLVASAAGAALVARLFRGETDADVRSDAALAFGLPVGLVVAALPGWLLSVGANVPVRGVALPLALAAAGILLGLFWRDLLALFAAPRRAVFPLVVFAATFLFYLWLRWPAGEIRHTEQPMDFAVLSGLMTTPTLPFQDPWMAGERFPYYHFATYLFALPIRVSGMAPEYGYNLVAALLPALAALAAFGAVRVRRAGRRLAAWAAALLAAGGTFDGLRQLLSRTGISEIDIWASSRRVDAGNAITEWPLFTFKLGDLHPHAVEFPLFVALAGLAGRVNGWAGIVLDGVLLAAIVSANPWDLPGALLAIAAGNMMERGFRASVFRGLATVAAAIPFLMPFLRAPRPAFHGLLFFPGSTLAVDAFLHFGTLLAGVALAAGVALVRARERSDEALLVATLFPAFGLAAALLMGKPVLGLAAGFVAAVAYLLYRTPSAGDATTLPKGALRAGLLYAAAGAILVALPDAVVVVDTYGEQHKRMNTVFKCFMAAWPLLAIGAALLLPLALATRHARVTIRGILAVALAGTLVHPLSAVLARLKSGPGTLDGLAWMTTEAPGDRKAIEWLRSHALPGAVVAEATGNPYTDYSRIGSASGRPTVLGWANHEGLWRGDQVSPGVTSRAAALRTLYTSTNIDEVRQIIRKFRVRYVAVGSLEKRDFGPGAFPTGPAFQRVFSEDGSSLYEVGP
jgi:YYY domain-containing protein